MQCSVGADVLARRVEREGFCVVDAAFGREHALELRLEVAGLEKSAATIATGMRMSRDLKKRDDVIAWLNKSEEPATRRHRWAMEHLREALSESLGLKTDKCSFACAEYVSE